MSLSDVQVATFKVGDHASKIAMGDHEYRERDLTITCTIGMKHIGRLYHLNWALSGIDCTHKMILGQHASSLSWVPNWKKSVLGPNNATHCILLTVLSL